MIRYRRLYEDEATSLDVPSIYGGDFYKDVKLYDVVKCAGYDWYIVDIEDDIVTLLAKSDFGVSIFDEKSNDYSYSLIRRYLMFDVFPELKKVNPIRTKLEDVRSNDPVWLLSVDEVKKLPREIRQFIDWWWLRSPGLYDDCATCVSDDGGILGDGLFVHDDSLAVRPAMRVHIKDLD